MLVSTSNKSRFYYFTSCQQWSYCADWTVDARWRVPVVWNWSTPWTARNWLSFPIFRNQKSQSHHCLCVCVLSSPESLFYNLVPPPFETGTHTLYSGGGVANGGEAVVPRLALGQTCAHTHHHQHHLHPNIRMATFGEITMPVGGVQLFLSGRLIPRNWTHFEVQHRN